MSGEPARWSQEGEEGGGGSGEFMVSKNYKPAMKPILRPAGEIRSKDKDPVPYPAQIIISGPLWRELRSKFDLVAQGTLEADYCGGSICPEQFFFLDTLQVRLLLGVAE
jgi:hypothetical protein